MQCDILNRVLNFSCGPFFKKLILSCLLIGPKPVEHSVKVSVKKHTFLLVLVFTMSMQNYMQAYHCMQKLCLIHPSVIDTGLPKSRASSLKVMGGGSRRSLGGRRRQSDPHGESSARLLKVYGCQLFRILSRFMYIKSVWMLFIQNFVSFYVH